MVNGLSSYRVRLAILTAILTLGGVSCSWVSLPGHTIKMVSSFPMDGTGRLQSETMVTAIRMALAEADNHAGPFHIEYEPMSDSIPETGRWDAARERENMQRAIHDPDVMVYIGTFNSGAAQLSIPVSNVANLVMISPDATYSGLTEGGPYAAPGEPDIYYPNHVRNFCRVVPNDVMQGTDAAWWAQKLGATRVYVVGEHEAYGMGLARVFSDQCRKRGLEVVGSMDVRPPPTRYDDVVNSIRAAHPDLVYFSGNTQSGAGWFLKALREAGVKSLFMGPDGLRETAFIEEAGNAAEGAYVSLGAMPVEKLPVKAKEWYDRYCLDYNSQPESYTIYAYEAARVAMAGIATAGVKDRGRIRDAIMHTRNFDGVLGRWSFDQNGDTTIDTFAGYQVHNHHFEFREMLTPN